jgi:hypothetical protein
MMIDNIVNVAFGPRAPGDLSQRLREIADAVDRGEVTSLVGAYVEAGDYCFLFGASISDGLILSTLMHDRALGQFKA